MHIKKQIEDANAGRKEVSQQRMSSLLSRVDVYQRQIDDLARPLSDQVCFEYGVALHHWILASRPVITNRICCSSRHNFHI